MEDAIFHTQPVAVVDEVINSFNDYACDSADAMEAALLDHPELLEKRDEIKQGIDRWQLKVQRAADKNFDKFELYALKNIFAVPEDLQMAPPEGPAAEEVRALDSEADAQYERLQRALATKRELQRKLAAAQSLAALWAAHRDSVAQLAAAQQASGVQSALDGSQQLTSTLRQGWQILEATDGASAAAVPPTAAGPRGLQQRFLQRRAEISTVSVPDLGLLSSLLCAS